MFKKFSLFLGIFSAALCASAHAANTVVIIPSGSVDKEVTVNPPGDATIYDVEEGFTFSSQDGIDLTGVLVRNTPSGDALTSDVVVGITFSKSGGSNLEGTLIPAPLPKTGQTYPFLPPTVLSGTDGDLQKGLTWPSPRFTDNGTTVTDTLTNLTWLKNASCLGTLTWVEAFTSLDNKVQTSCGIATTGWRVPNIRELTSLISYQYLPSGGPVLPSGHPFTNVNVTAPYLTSTTMAGVSAYNAFGINLADGTTAYSSKSGTAYPVWAVKN